MASNSPEATTTPDKKGDAKTDTKSSKESVFKLGSKTLQTGNKNEAAHKIADSSIWETLIPKSGEKKVESSHAVPATAPEKPETAELAPDAPTERLSRDELQAVVRDRAGERRSEIEAETPENQDPAEAAADEASLKFYEALAENPATVPELVAELPDDTASEEASDEDMPESEPAELPDAAEAIELEAPAEVVPEAPTEFEHNQAIELNAEKPPEDEAKPTSTTSTLTAKPAAGVGGGGANQPPSPPSPPSGGPGGPANPNFNPFTSGGGTNPNAGPNPNAAPTHIENNYYQENGGAYLLAGGILGYMLGRRRGRIKTEKKLRAVTKNLERQIKQTHERIDRQELVIREQARERFNQTHAAETMANRPEQRPKPEVAQPRKTEKLVATAAEIAAVGVTAEQVSKLERRELLATAAKIDVDGTNLRQIYEAKQITEPGLRRLTQEYLRGGDIRPALQHERQVMEMQYERDPQMRDRLAASYAEIDAARPQSAQEALSSLLAQDKAPSPQALQAAQQAAAAEAQQVHKPHNQVLISAWVAFVVILAIIAVVLAMR